MSNRLVYVELLDEGSPTIRGTQAIEMGNNLFQLLPTPDYNPEDEVWEFLPGSVVRCEERENFGERLLIAVEEVKENTK